MKDFEVTVHATVYLSPVSKAELHGSLADVAALLSTKFAEPADPPEARDAAASQLLRTMLAGGPVSIKDVFWRAEAMGFSPDEMTKARLDRGRPRVQRHPRCRPLLGVAPPRLTTRPRRRPRVEPDPCPGTGPEGRRAPLGTVDPWGRRRRGPARPSGAGVPPDPHKVHPETEVCP